MLIFFYQTIKIFKFEFPLFRLTIFASSSQKQLRKVDSTVKLVVWPDENKTSYCDKPFPKMSRISGKLNIIDHNTYQNLKHEHGDAVPRVLRSAKYKNKHKKEQQCTLFDFLVVPRKKQKHTNRKKRPHLHIARNSITFQPKRKGKTRLHPKHRVTRLKRIIRRFHQFQKSNV